ncbi:MAG: PQQ-binding-like beta-propeller repeat protein, partial [Candidatus Bathyarchaeota archaeon]|nr:PQQ-binding-like beta-propeller repeat protein [Candidatus Bathyarchaeota archaeon]
MSVMLVALPSVTGQGAGEKMTYAYLGAIPSPVGVNQQVLLHVGITQELRSVAMGWEGLSVSIVDPEGIEISIEDIRTDSTGGTGVAFTPDKVGTYQLQTHFPEQVTTSTKQAGSMFTGYVPTGTVMLASDSEILTLIVQEESIPYYPGQSKPNEYWTRPIDAQLREWSPIAGSWLFGAGIFGGTDVPNRYVPFNEDAPESAHILWTKPFTIGGLAGGTTGVQGIECGDAYEGKWGGSLVLAGKLYYLDGAYDRPRLIHCVDLHTGEELWAKTFLDGETLDFGQLFYWDSYNYHGVFPYLYVATGGGGFFFAPPGPETWTAFDPFTGEWRFTIENVPGGTKLTGPNGEFYKLDVDLQDGTMGLWNMTALISNQGSWGSQAHLRTHNGEDPDAWNWNVPIPTDLPGNVQASKFGDKVVGGSVSTTEVQSWAISLEPGKEGTELYRKTWNAPAEWAAGNQTVSWAGTSIDEGVFVVWSKETRQYYGFSTETGDHLWTTESQYYLDFLIATQTAIVYDKLYSAGVSGITYCYDLTTGDQLWTYEATDPYQEILWSNYWWAQIVFITDGKLYVGHSEHSPIDPKPRGAPFYCLNATNGEEIWRSEGLFRQSNWGGTAVIGDSIIATQDTYDQRVYAIGKGGSEITASIQNNVVPLGSTVLVDGTVMDVSPGTEDTATKLRFPNGVPAVSDASMSDWMLYVYKNFERPADATGVTVKFEAVDPNGNYQELGDTISDSYGSYGFEFKPEITGKYMIIATFQG